jgi:hypothetical protein
MTRKEWEYMLERADDMRRISGSKIASDQSDCVLNLLDLLWFLMVI